MEKAGRSERVDHRSLKDQGIEREPQPKIGVAATAMKRKGTLLDPERFQLVRKIKMANEALPFFKNIRQRGEVKQIKQRGVGEHWWEQSITFAASVKTQAEKMVKDTWRKLFPARAHTHSPAKEPPTMEM